MKLDGEDVFLNTPSSRASFLGIVPEDVHRLPDELAEQEEVAAEVVMDAPDPELEVDNRGGLEQAAILCWTCALSLRPRRHRCLLSCGGKFLADGQQSSRAR